MEERRHRGRKGKTVGRRERLERGRGDWWRNHEVEGGRADEVRREEIGGRD